MRDYHQYAARGLNCGTGVMSSVGPSFGHPLEPKVSLEDFAKHLKAKDWLFASAVGMDGYLRRAYNSWVEDPLKSTDFTSWPSGDCFLVYPGKRSSVRFERLRDGIEGWEKILLIREAAARFSKMEAASVLDSALVFPASE